MAELNAYVLAHLVWDVDLSEGHLTNEFLDGYYGKASPFVRAYVHMRRDALPLRSSGLSIYGNPIDNRNDFLSTAAMDSYSSLLEKAETSVEGDKKLEERIRRIGLGLDYTYLQLCLFFGSRQYGVFEKIDGHWMARPYVVQKIKQLVSDTKQIGMRELAEGGPSPDEYLASWDSILNGGIRINKANDAVISVKHMFDPSFPANGISALTDSVPGYLDFSYNWLIWNGKPMDATVRLREKTYIDSLDVNFLQDACHWIFPPKEVRMFVSTDGIHFKEIFRHKTKKIEKDDKVRKVRFNVSVRRDILAVRIYAAPQTSLPPWRFVPNRQPLLACDEIWLE